MSKALDLSTRKCFEDAVVLGNICNNFFISHCSNVQAHLHEVKGPLQTCLAAVSLMCTKWLAPVGPGCIQFTHVLLDLHLILLQLLHQRHERCTLEWLLQICPFLSSLEDNLTVQLVQHNFELRNPGAINGWLGICVCFENIIHGAHVKGSHQLILLAVEIRCRQLALQVLQVKLETSANLLHSKDCRFISCLSKTSWQSNPVAEDAIDDHVLGLCSAGHPLIPPLIVTVGLVAKSEPFASNGRMGERATRHAVGGPNPCKLGSLLLVPDRKK